MPKKYYFFSLICVFLFAVFVAGGCGGSSSSNRSGNQSQTENETQAEIPDITDVFETSELAQALDELDEELRAEGIDFDTFEGPKVHFVFIISGDRAYIDDELDGTTEANRAKISATLPQSEIERIAAILKPGYESGDVIALYFPSAVTINDLYEALGEQPSYFAGLVSDDAREEDTYPEIYAIAKRYGETSVHYFSYEVPGSKAILLENVFEALNEAESVDVSLQQDPSLSSDDTISEVLSSDLRQEYLFQARRYMKFVKWVALLDKRTAELEANSPSVQAAFRQAAPTIRTAAEAGNFISFNSQNVDRDFSDCYDHDFNGQGRYHHKMNYSSGTSYTIYSCHNYADGDDYYLFKQNSFSTPHGVRIGEKNGGWEYCNFGQLATIETWTTVRNASTSDVYAIQTAPQSVNRSGSRTDGVSQTIGGKFGVNAGASDKGPSAGASSELSASLTYNNSKTWSTSEWRLDNDSTATTTKWVAKCTREDDRYLADYSNGHIPSAWQHRIDINSEWIWRVRKQFWSKYKNIPLEACVKTWLGCTLWEYHWYKSNENESYYHATYFSRYFDINRPPHVYVDQKSFNFGPGRSTAMFKMLCNNDYTITSSESWCQISAEQRVGSDTGATEREIFLAVDAYSADTTTFQTRSAKITVRENSTGDTQTITITQRNR